MGEGALSSSACSTSLSSQRRATSNGRMSGWTLQRLPNNSLRRSRMAKPPERANQRYRTRKDLLTAASRLMKEGRKPTLEEVAEAALVSRATAYRYFPSVEALLIEASVDITVPDGATLFAGDPSV